MNTHSMLLCIAFFGIYGCRSHTNKHDTHHPSDASLQSHRFVPSPGWAGGSDSLMIAGHPIVASRRSDTLFVHLRSGKTRALVDVPVEGDSAVAYRFRGQIRGSLLLVEVGYYEGGTFLLVNDSSGADVAIDSPPEFSPDNRRFVTASSDLESNYDPNRIAVWVLTDSVPIQEWSIEPENWGPVAPRWLGNSLIRFRIDTLPNEMYSPGSEVPMDSVGEINLEKDHWNLAPMKQRKISK